jgi:hypothetical protein
MLKNLRDAIRRCLQRAEDCAQKAAAESDPSVGPLEGLKSTRAAP